MSVYMLNNQDSKIVPVHEFVPDNHLEKTLHYVRLMILFGIMKLLRTSCGCFWRKIMERFFCRSTAGPVQLSLLYTGVFMLICGAGSFLDAAELSSEEQAWLAGREEIIVACDDAYPPFEFRNQNGDLDGMMVEVIRWIATEYGFRVRFLPSTLVEVQQAVLNGQADMISFLFYSESRDRVFDFSGTVFEIPATIFVRADRPDVRSVDDLAQLTVGLPDGDYAVEFLKKQQFTGNIVLSGTMQTVTENLLEGRVDAIIGDEQVVLYQLYQSGKISRVKRLEKPLYVGEARMVVAEKNRVLLGILEKGVNRAHEKGIIDAIARKWLGVRYHNAESPRRNLGPVLGALGVLVLLLLVTWFWNLQLKRKIADHTNELRLANEQLTADIAARRKAEEDMAASEERYRVLVARLPDIVLVHENGLVVFANDAGRVLAGVDDGELTGHHLYEFIHPQDREEIAGYLGAGMPHTDVIHEIRACNNRGETRYFEFRTGSISYDGREMAMVVLTDVSGRVKAEEDLRESEEKFRSTVELLPVGIYEFDLEGRFVYANSKALKMFGYEPDTDLRQLRVSDVVIPSEQNRAARNIEHVFRTNQPMNFLYTALRADGSTFPLEIHSSVVLRKGTPAGLRGVLIDVTDKKRAEDEFLRTNKLESVGLLAGGIAHDFNNILTAIMGNVHLASSLVEETPAAAFLRDADRACRRARDLTYQLLTFSKGGEPVMESARIDDILHESAVSHYAVLLLMRCSN